MENSTLLRIDVINGRIGLRQNFLPRQACAMTACSEYAGIVSALGAMGCRYR